MALDNTHLQPATLSGDSGLSQLMMYQTADDNAATVETNGYFDSLVDQFRDGDVLLCIMSDATKLYKVTKTAGDIALSTGTAIS